MELYILARGGDSTNCALFTRLIIDKLAVDEWGSGSGNSSNSNSVAVITGRTQTAAARALHAGKSPGEWSAGESLLMLEDACKNERKHSEL